MKISIILSVLLFVSCMHERESVLTPTSSKKIKIVSNDDMDAIQSVPELLFKSKVDLTPRAIERKVAYKLIKLDKLYRKLEKTNSKDQKQKQLSRIKALTHELRGFSSLLRRDNSFYKTVEEYIDRVDSFESLVDFKNVIKGINKDSNLKTDKVKRFVEITSRPVENKRTEVPRHVEKEFSFTRTINSKINKSNSTIQCDGVSLSDPDPMGTSLTASDFFTNRTANIINLADSLESPGKMFHWVRDNIKFIPKYGATQSAEQTATSLFGTASDMSTLYVSMLRAKGVAAQVIYGDIYLEEDKAKRLYGVDGKYDLYWALNDQLWHYYKEKTIINYVSGKRTWLIPHTWVRAHINGEWKEIDLVRTDYDYGSAAPELRGIDFELNEKGFLIGENRQGNFEKPGTFVDYILETFGDDFRGRYGSNLSISDIGLPSRGRSITPVSEDLSFGTISETTPCYKLQEDIVHPDYKYTVELELVEGTTTLFTSEYSMAEVSEKNLRLTHSSGLFGKVGASSGTMFLNLGNDLQFSKSINTSSFVKYNFFRRASRAYYFQSDGFAQKGRSVRAGGATTFFAESAPRSSRNLYDEIKSLRSLLSMGSSDPDLYTQFLRVGNILTSIINYEADQTNAMITGTVRHPDNIFVTYDSNGVLTDRDDRPYARIPIGTSITWTSGAASYSKSGNYRSSLDYLNNLAQKQIDSTTGSAVEAAVWEILFGMPGGSSVKVLQLAAKDHYKDGKENILIEGEILGAGNDSTIFAKFGSETRSFINTINDPGRGYIKYNSKVYSLTKKYVEGDFNAKILQMYPTHHLASWTALYGAEVSNFDDVGPNGGGGRGTNPSPALNPESQDRPVVDISKVGSSTDFSNCPVSYANGVMVHQWRDFNIPGRTSQTSINFTRTYNTQTFEALGDLGPNFVHDYQTRLVSADKNETSLLLATRVAWIKPGGSRVIFTKQADNSFKAPKSVVDTMTEFVDRFEVRIKGGLKYVYFKTSASPAPGRLQFIEEPHGERINLTYDPQGRLDQVSTNLAGSISFSYDTSNRIASILRDRDNLNYTYLYDAEGRLASSSDFNGVTTTYSYVTDRPGTKAQGLMSSFANHLGHGASFDYYDNGRVYEEVGPAGGKSNYLYAIYLVDHFTRVLGENGSTRIYKYDDEFYQTEVQFPDGGRTQKVYNDDGFVVEEIDQLGYSTKYQYDSRGNKTGIMPPESSEFVHVEYDSIFDKVTKVTPLIGADVISTIDPITGDILNRSLNGQSENLSLDFTYDNFGKILSTDNGLATYSDNRNANGLLTKRFDARNETSFTYDSRFRLKTQVSDLGRTIEYEYDDYDRITRINDSHGPDTISDYDVLGRLVFKTSTDGVTNQVTAFEYDSANRLIKQTDPSGRVTEFEFDTPALGCKHITNQPVKITDAAGRVTRFEYDEMGRRVRSIDAENSVIRNEFNLRGDLAAVTDPTGRRTVFRYDGRGRRVREERPSVKTDVNSKTTTTTQVIETVYDEADRIIQKIQHLPSKRNGTEVAKLITEFSYDDFGNNISQKVKEEFMGEILTHEIRSFTYKKQLDNQALLTANNEVVKLGFSYEVLPPFSLLEFSTEATNNLNPLDLIEKTLQVEPSPIGSPKRIREGNVVYLDRTFNPDNTLQSITGKFLGKTLSVNLTYDDFNREKTISFGNGVIRTNQYDILNRQTNISYNGSGESFSEAIVYNGLSGDLDQITREIGVFDFTYNKQSELLTSSYTGSEILGPLVNREYGLDRSGNRLDDNILGEGKYLNNALLSNDDFEYFYDENGLGNLVQKTYKNSEVIDVFDWLDDGKLRRFKRIDKVPFEKVVIDVEYFYDALGRRVAKKITTPSKKWNHSFLHLGLRDKILLAQDGKGERSLYIDGEGIDQHFGKIEKSVKYFVVDHLGSVMNEGVNSEKRAVGIFGEVLGSLLSLEVFGSPVNYGYTGREMDVESGIYYYRNRYYDPTAGRFLSQDPIGLAGGDTNLYRYVSNKVVDFNDPLGLMSPHTSGGQSREFAGEQFRGRQLTPLEDAELQRRSKEGLLEVVNFTYDLFAYAALLGSTPLASFIGTVDDLGSQFSSTAPNTRLSPPIGELRRYDNSRLCK